MFRKNLIFSNPLYNLRPLLLLLLITLLTFTTLVRLLNHIPLQQPPQNPTSAFTNSCGTTSPTRQTHHRTFTPTGLPLCNHHPTVSETTTLLGVLTTAAKSTQRMAMRSTIGRDTNGSIRLIFVIGSQSFDPDSYDQLRTESTLYGDMLLLDVPENGDNGKTYEYFSTVAKLFKECPFTYVAKIDDDVWMHLPNLQERLDGLVTYTNNEGVYWGSLWDWEAKSEEEKERLGMERFQYMSGMGYILSWNLIHWISTDSYPPTAKHGPEDWMLGLWMKHLGEQRSNQTITYPGHEICPSGEGLPHYACVDKDKANDYIWVKGGMRGFDRRTVLMVHPLKATGIWCEVDRIYKP